MDIISELRAEYYVVPYQTYFIVQIHTKPNKHFDLRIRRGDVAVSWAIPKAKLPEIGEKILAVHTPDHSLDAMLFGFTYTVGSPDDVYRVYTYGTCVIYEWSYNKVTFGFENFSGEFCYYSLILMKNDDWLFMRHKSLKTDITEKFNFNTTLIFINNENNALLEYNNMVEMPCYIDNTVDTIEYIEEKYDVTVSKIDTQYTDGECSWVGEDIEESFNTVLYVHIAPTTHFTEADTSKITISENIQKFLGGSLVDGNYTNI